jgi:hypothetical protein
MSGMHRIETPGFSPESIHFENEIHPAKVNECVVSILFEIKLKMGVKCDQMAVLFSVKNLFKKEGL